MGALANLFGGLRNAANAVSPVVFRRRIPEILQFEVTECGTCCLAMVLSYFGHWVSLDRLRDLCGASRDGISAGSLARAAKQMNLNVKGFGVKADELADLPMPQILFWNFNHFIVLESVHGDVVEVVDPAVGRRRLRLVDLEAGYCGVTLCMAPDAEFKRTGSRPSVLREMVKAAEGSGMALSVISLVSFGMALMMMLVPALTSIFIDYVLIRKGVERWQLWFILGIGVFGFALGPVMWMQKAGSLKLQTRLAMTLAARIVTKMFLVPLDYFTRRFGGEVGGRVMLADTVAATVSGALIGMIASSMQVLVLGLAMFSYSVFLTALTFGLLLLHALLAGWIIRRTTNLSRLLALERGRYEAQLINAVNLVEHNRASGTTQAMLQRVLERYIAVANAEQGNAPFAALLGSLPGAMTGILMAVITGLSAREVILGEFTIGVFVAYTAMAYILLSPFNQIISAISQVGNAGGSFERVNDLLQEAAADPHQANGDIPEAWDLVGKEVSFSYGAQQVLREVSFTIPQGSYVGIVGSVGSGKSTLLSLLVRILNPSAGQLQVGGMPMARIDRDKFCTSIALVPQKDHIFEGTVLDNITLWDPKITDKEAMAACQLCMIHEEIVRRPGGYRSRLREGGTDLSGGQRQRIALARAVVRDPRILVLDEATSALDGKTEAAVLNNLRGRQGTLVFATHRMANMRTAETILVMDAGRIKESGSHDQLVASGGVYAALVASSGGLAA
jgi:ABC-type bacteriocin/lantibiotic exporter with double-glycine peptidase domain